MTREQILRDRLDMASHNLYCYSENLSMSKPKAGYEDKFKEAADEVNVLEKWLNEFHRTRTDSRVEYVGHISCTSYGKTYDGKKMADSIEFEVDTGAPYLYGDSRIFKVSKEAQHWFVGDEVPCGKYDMEKDHRASRLLRVTVDRLMYVRYIEWAEDE